MILDVEAERFVRLLRRLGASAGVEEVAVDVMRAYDESHRRYHDRSHLRDVLALLDDVSVHAGRPDEVELGLFFHDAIYEPTASDNEERSAAWALDALSILGISPSIAARVASAVRATRSHEASTDDERLLLDIDLAILAAPEAAFSSYETRLREEFAIVPDEFYWPARVMVIESFLERGRIYASSPLRHLEEPARENLRRSLARSMAAT